MKRLIVPTAAILATALLAGCSKHDTINISDENKLVSDDYADGNSDQSDNTFDGNFRDATPAASNSSNAF